jgi:hypothetical protein
MTSSVGSVTAAVTTLDDGDVSGDLAACLTHLSEGAWDAAPWLDTYPVIEASITELISHLRGPDDIIPQISLPGTGYRHVSQWIRQAEFLTELLRDRDIDVVAEVASWLEILPAARAKQVQVAVIDIILCCRLRLKSKWSCRVSSICSLTATPANACTSWCASWSSVPC